MTQAKTNCITASPISLECDEVGGNDNFPATPRAWTGAAFPKPRDPDYYLPDFRSPVQEASGMPSCLALHS